VDEKNIRLTLTYDGSQYHGWQRQDNGITIQEVVEEKLKIMLGAPIKLLASGRTDAGVHAMDQVCNFTTRSNIEPDAIRRGLNSLLPDDIHVNTTDYVPGEFHARYSAISKIYQYWILNQTAPNVFLRHYLWHIRAPLDTGEMAKSLAILIGSHDFSSFKSSGSSNTNPVRTISRAELYGPDEDGILRVIIEADGFLRHMVRNIVGTVVEVGLGKMSTDGFREVLEAKDRQAAGIKAPAQGLFLVSVRY
jgi:tRNA pseudouridine38-40 synthase